MNAAEKMVAEFSSRGLVCAVAESCTGGAVGSAIVSVSGASAVFAGGVISYSNSVKMGLLGVREQDLAAVGAVRELLAHLKKAFSFPVRFLNDIHHELTAQKSPELVS